MVDNRDKLRELESYLYTNLSEIIDETEDSILAAYRVALTIAFHTQEVDDVRIDLYTSRLKIDPSLMGAAISYFCGAGFLDIPDSVYQDEENEAYQLGKLGQEEESELYSATKGRIETFREAFWNDDW